MRVCVCVRVAQAFNTVCQGTAADVLKKAMLWIQGELRRLSPGAQFFSEGAVARLVCTVHDELVLEVREERLEEVMCLVRLGMEHAQQGLPLIPVRMKVGRDWGHMDPVSAGLR